MCWEVTFVALYSWRVQAPVEERTRSVIENLTIRPASYGVHHVLNYKIASIIILQKLTLTEDSRSPRSDAGKPYTYDIIVRAESHSRPHVQKNWSVGPRYRVVMQQVMRLRAE